MEWLEFAKQLGDAPFKGLVLITLVHGIKELGKIRKSVERLNIALAVRDEAVNGQEKVLLEHGRRLRNLERKK